VLEAPGQDEWLRRQVRECLDTEYDDLRLFFQVEAVGMIHRWRNLPREEGQRLVKALLTGDHETVEGIDLPRTWSRYSLTDEQRREIEDTMFWSVVRLEDFMREITEGDLEGPDYDRAMNHLILERERLECVAFVVAGDRMNRALKRLDEEGWVQIRALPDFELTADATEVLERASLIDFESWWVRPVTRRWER